MVAEAEFVPVNEGSTEIVATRDDLAPPGSRTASRTKGRLRNTGDPTGSRGVRVTGGAVARDNRSGAPSRGRESDWSIVPAKPRRRRNGGGKGPAQGEPAGGSASPDSEPEDLAAESDAGERGSQT